MIISIIIGLSLSYLMLFLLSVSLKDNSIADIFWGLGFLQVAIHSLILSGTMHVPQLVMFTIILMWSLRISIYISLKKLARPGEDKRYVKWRENWKFFYTRSFFQVYVLQGALLLIIAAPLIIFNRNPPTDITAFLILGTIISMIGLIIETIADMQMKSFVRRKKEGEIMKEGLWHYSRHPNYFGESTFWLGVCVIALQVSWVALISWMTITILLRYVSGVPLAEERYLNNPKFQEYMKTTPPMFPRLTR